MEDFTPYRESLVEEEFVDHPELFDRWVRNQERRQ
jgi:hypothetical protein